MTNNQKSNKHSHTEVKEIVDRPNHEFELVEPDEVLSYK
jgi:hypothetical protein